MSEGTRREEEEDIKRGGRRRRLKEEGEEAEKVGRREEIRELITQFYMIDNLRCANSLAKQICRGICSNTKAVARNAIHPTSAYNKYVKTAR